MSDLYDQDFYAWTQAQALATFPDTCPWTLEQILADDFFPPHQR